MSFEPTFQRKDEDKSREDLVEDLKRLRCANASYKEVIERYKVLLDLIKESDDGVPEELMVQKDHVESLNALIQEKNEELQRQHEEFNIQNGEFRRANRALKALSECKEAMIRAGDETVLLNDICRIIVDVGGYRMAWIGYIENDGIKTVRPVARAGYDDGYVDNLKIALEDPERGNGPTGISLNTGKPYGSRNVQSDDEMRPWREEALKRGYHSTLNLPIVYEKQVIGTLAIYSGEVDVFDEEERELLFGLAQTLAYGITAMRDRARRILAEEEVKRANEELEKKIEERTAKHRESEERFRSYFELPLIGITITSVDKKWIQVNDKMCDILGYSREELLHRTWADITHPDDISKNVEMFNKLLSGEIDGYTLEKRFIRKNGDIVYTIISVGCVRRFDGTIDYFVTTAQDISDRKRIEKELMDAKSQAELYVDLMGHDINNMNQVGMGFLELALDTLNLDENGQSLLTKPISAFESSTKLIDNVRKLQRVKSGELRNTEMDIGQVLKDVQYHYSHIHGGNVSINYVPITGYAVKANELLYDVFSNIVGNAIKHSNNHPVINIKVEQVQEKKLDYYMVSIEDNGPGIPDDLKPMIFNRRLRGGSKTRGSGIGLFLVKTLVDDYGGSVWVEDRVQGEISKGSRFVVILPAI